MKVLLGSKNTTNNHRFWCWNCIALVLKLHSRTSSSVVIQMIQNMTIFLKTVFYTKSKTFNKECSGPQEHVLGPQFKNSTNFTGYVVSLSQEFILLLQDWASELKNKDIPPLLWDKRTSPNQITSLHYLANQYSPANKCMTRCFCLRSFQSPWGDKTPIGKF